MLIDLSKLLTHEGKQQQVEIFPSGDTFSCELGEFSYGEKEPVKLTIKHKENQILNISAKGQVAVWIPCSRCLEPVPSFVSMLLASASMVPAFSSMRLPRSTASSTVSSGANSGFWGR